MLVFTNFGSYFVKNEATRQNLKEWVKYRNIMQTVFSATLLTNLLVLDYSDNGFAIQLIFLVSLQPVFNICYNIY